MLEGNLVCAYVLWFCINKSIKENKLYITLFLVEYPSVKLNAH